MLALTLLAALQPVPARPVAFLDGWKEVRFAVDRPIETKELKGRVHFKIAGRAIAITGIEPTGKPVSAANTSISDPNKVVIAGTIQSALGGNDWDPNDDVSRCTEIAKGVYTLVAQLPVGDYEYKVARGGSWAENYGTGFAAGGGNISLHVPKKMGVSFRVDFGHKAIWDSINNPDKVPTPPTLATVPPIHKGLYKTFTLRLGPGIGTESITDPMTLQAGPTTYSVVARNLLDDPAFDDETAELGSRLTSNHTTFQVWNPTAQAANVRLYANAKTQTYQGLPMHRNQRGTWMVIAPGNLDGTYYQYEFKDASGIRTAADLNGYAASRDGMRSMVIDLRRTDVRLPAAPGPQRLEPLNSPCDAILYEMSIRDFSVSPQSGVPEQLRGKYLGACYQDANAKQAPLSFVQALGINTLHIMPMQMFNPDRGNDYSWGYETSFFNVPEPQFSTKPDDPRTTIWEAKRMFAGFHRAGLRAVMDVVYNHTVPTSGPKSAFWQTLPYYYFRTDDTGALINESGVGNALNDDHPMVRKFVRDSLTYWTKEYGVDGFRFDLLGMFTKTSVADWSEAVHKLRPDAIIYGEPWTGGGKLRFGKGAQKGLGVAVFNDNFRNAIRGEMDSAGPGFATGSTSGNEAIAKGLMGSVGDFTSSPTESINYVSCHDNMTLWDKINKTLPTASRAEKLRAFALSNALILLGQGVPFLEGGAEIGRTKGGSRDSYNLGDGVNQFNWANAGDFADATQIIKDLVSIRKAHPALRLGTAEKVNQLIKLEIGQNWVAAHVSGSKAGDTWGDFTIFFASKPTDAPRTEPPLAGDLDELGYSIYKDNP